MAAGRDAVRLHVRSTDGRRVRFRRGSYLLALTAWSAYAVPALANPHLSSFDDARHSPVDFARPVVTKPAGDCSVARLPTPSGAVIVSAVRLRTPASGREYCEVRGVAGAEAQFLVLLPTPWNGRLYVHGNGGFAGESLDAPLGRRARLKAIETGFAAAFTDTGHEAAAAPDGRWALNNVSREVDFAFRALHASTVAAKTLISSYYGRPAARAYFDGCSTGGRQGLIAAQRFPADFDGILAGAPVLDMTGMLWKYWQNQRAIDTSPLTSETLERLASIVFDRYDALDGLADGVIADPLAIDFSPQRDLRDARGTALAGLSDADIATLEQIYGPLEIGGQQRFPRLVVGSERPGLMYAPESGAPVAPQSAWMTRVVPDERGTLGQRGLVETWFRYLAFTPDEPALDWRSLDPSRDLARNEQARRLMDATDPDLDAFASRGGRLLIYHGWADFGVSPLRTIEYVETVTRRRSEGISNFVQLYLVPGMFHCEGGLDVDRFDLMTPLVNWVETGSAPGVIAGTRIENERVVRTRPVCPYPLRRIYRGRGDGSRADSFECAAPQRPSTK